MVPPTAAARASAVFSVSELNRRLRSTLEVGFSSVWVAGEISNLRVPASGHVYFRLKDSGAQIAAVMFRSSAARVAFRPRDGMEVLIRGRVSMYEARGDLQVYVDAMEPQGVGSAQIALQQLKEKLAAEGLFAAGRKQALPAWPRTVGVVTALSGAAIHDIITTLRSRMPGVRILVRPVTVQGQQAGAEIAAALLDLQADATADVIIVGRGGGSAEDLWAFNEEPLVRAVAACRVPIISAVGHEIDFTLCDFAADLRAETPSAAAELITSHFVSCTERVRQGDEAMSAFVEARVQQAIVGLDHARSRLRLLSPATQIEQGFLRLDDFANRLGAALRHSTQLRREKIAEAKSLLAQYSPEKRVQTESHRLLSLWKRLQAASPCSVLNRGFVILRDEAGKPVARRAQTTPRQRLAAEFVDGTVPVRVE